MHPRSIPGADKFARFGVEKMQCIAMPFSVCFEKALYLLEISFAFSFFRRHSRSEFYSFNHHRALIGEQLKSPQLQLRPASPSFAQLRPASPSFAQLRPALLHRSRASAVLRVSHLEPAPWYPRRPEEPVAGRFVAVAFNPDPHLPKDWHLLL